jgi:hypothetical protein
MLIREIASITQGLATSGRGAGAREGDWRLTVVDGGDIEADVVNPENARVIAVEQNPRTEKHLLRPFDVLVTARSQSVKVALVPPQVTRTVAGPTLLVVRPLDPETGVSQYLWYYLTSRQGRAAVEARVAAGASIPSLSAAALGEVDVPIPDLRKLHVLAELIEASEDAYGATITVARMQREVLRDSIIGRVAQQLHASIGEG